MKKVVLTDLRDENLYNGTLLKDIMRWVNDKEVMFFFANVKGRIKQAEEIEFLKSIIYSANDIVYSIRLKDGTYIGQVSINKIDWVAKTARLFMVITPKQQGKGYAVTAIQEAQRKAFLMLGLNKLYIIVRYDNEKGRHLYKRCGFETEGILREEYFVNGKYYDMVRMSILKREFPLWWK